MAEQNTLALEGGEHSHTFNFQETQVRVIERDGEPWFVAADVCAVLGLDNTTKAMKCLNADEYALTSIQGLSRGNNKGNIISEGGLYKLIMRSNKAEAKAFQNWVTGEVLPTIRKTGSYSAQPQPQGVDEVDRRIALAFSMAVDSGTAVQKAIFKALMEDAAADVYHARFALTVSPLPYPSNQPARVILQPIPQDAIVTNLEQLAVRILEPGGMHPKVKDLAQLAAACNQRLVKRVS